MSLMSMFTKRIKSESSRVFLGGGGGSEGGREGERERERERREREREGERASMAAQWRETAQQPTPLV